MQRIKELTEADLTSEQRVVWDRIVSGPRGKVELTHNVWMRNPALSEHIQSLGAYLRFEILTDKQRELAILVTARSWNCELEWLLHKQQALAAGHAETDLAIIAGGGKPDFAEPDLSAIHDFVVELNAKQDIGGAAFENAKRALGEKGVVELIALTGFYVMTAMLIKSFRFAMPEGASPEFHDSGTGHQR
jgi:4-carboxymuconolactone decarboxylase